MTRILMVCLGNICRSPLAHGVMESKLSKTKYYVDSAGTAAYHVGNAPDKRSIAIARQNGLDISRQSARQFKISDFDAFDYIYAMDQSNYDNIIRLARSNEDVLKVKRFLEVNLQVENKNMPDPYYGDATDFEYVYNLVNETCNILVKHLKE